MKELKEGWKIKPKSSRVRVQQKSGKDRFDGLRSEGGRLD